MLINTIRGHVWIFKIVGKSPFVCVFLINSYFRPPFVPSCIFFRPFFVYARIFHVHNCSLQTHSARTFWTSNGKCLNSWLMILMPVFRTSNYLLCLFLTTKLLTAFGYVLIHSYYNEEVHEISNQRQQEKQLKFYIARRVNILFPSEC